MKFDTKKIATHCLSKNVYFNICHGKIQVTAVDKFQKFRVDTPLKLENSFLFTFSSAEHDSTKCGVMQNVMCVVELTFKFYFTVNFVLSSQLQNK